MLPGIPLTGVPSHLEYFPNADAVYAGYPDGRITRLEEQSGLETGFRQFGAACEQMFATGEHLLAVDKGQNSPAIIHSLDEQGNAVSTLFLSNNFLSHMRYVPGRHEVIGRTGSWWYRQALDENGVPTGWPVRPSAASDPSMNLLIGIFRFSATGERFVSRQGGVYETETFEKIGQYPHGFTDMRWYGESLISLADNGNKVSRISWWNDYENPSEETLVEGLPLSLSVTDTEIRVITLVEGQPRFTTLSHELYPLHESTINRLPERIEISSPVVLPSAIHGDEIGTLLPVHENNSPRTYTYELVQDFSNLFTLDGDILRVSVSGTVADKTRGWPDLREITIRVTDEYGANAEYHVVLEIRPETLSYLEPTESAGRPFEHRETILDGEGVLHFV
ncbi:MAG: hypothetical protein P5701_24805, partial [Limnospira sp. Paracas R14]|nr:hypothetical protein [Limnospira sp. Paracas R14]